MNVPVMERQPDASTQTKLGFVDCDVHPYTKTPADLDAFLPERWRKLRQSIGNRARSPFAPHRPIPGCRPAPACGWTPGRRMAAIPAPTSP
ncbi:MAG: hypothetical protein P4L71_05310 [Acetobacteraceae bacterium]|nr:hypothetical protein [Acetobacteraceae bacterium]